MQVSIYSGDVTTSPTDLLVIAIDADTASKKLIKTSPITAIDSALGGAVKSAAKQCDFSGQARRKLVLHTLGRLRATRVAIVGLGKKKLITPRTWLELGGSVTRLANEVGAKSATILVTPELDNTPEAVAAIARGAELGSYRFLEYKSDTGRKPSLARLAIHADKSSAAACRRQLPAAAAVAGATMVARDLVNRSPLQLYPETFAAEAVKLGRKAGLKVKVYKPADLERMGMNLLLGVGAGSTRGPRLVHLSYRPKGGKAKQQPTVLVGKGVTFDSGGLSLKPPASMVDMKSDMGGAAAVFGAMLAIAEIGPNVAVDGLLTLAENMPSGSAIRPGDVITSAAGKTVEINNTDAEGRLVLADALHFATNLKPKPKRIIDVATLTGACMVALGPNTVGAFSNNDALAEAILASAKHVGEDFWRLPLTESLKDQLKSPVADMKNTGERWGGAITAGLFLREFIGDIAWAHLDIAGPATTSKQTGYLSKGGTGASVATLAQLVCGK